MNITQIWKSTGWRAAMLAFSCCLLLSPANAEESWPQWRGEDQTGFASGDGFPIRWNEDSGIAWKIELPGRGGSTPVVDDSTAYLTAGIDGENTLLAIDTANGKLKWQTSLGEDRGHKHRKGSGSNPSPVIDGDSIFAYFRSGDLACVGTDGAVKWSVNLQDKYGEDTLWWDLGSSPTVTDDAVVVAVMQSGPSYLIGLEKDSGDVLWKADRMLDAPQEAAQSYATPLTVEVDGKALIAVMGADHLTLHQATDGKQLAELGGFNPEQNGFFRSIASPVALGNIIVCPYARGETLTAVRMDQLLAGKGEDAILWFRDDLGSDVPTPAVRDGRVYIGADKSNSGTVSCLDIETGQTLWDIRLPRASGGTMYSSSPLIAGNHLYMPREDATTFVIGPLDSNDPEVVSFNEVEDQQPYTVASPVPVGNDLLLRTRNRLYRIAGSPDR